MGPDSNSSTAPLNTNVYELTIEDNKEDKGCEERIPDAPLAPDAFLETSLAFLTKSNWAMSIATSTATSWNLSSGLSRLRKRRQAR